MEQSPNPLNSAWLRMQGAAVVFILTSLPHQHMGERVPTQGQTAHMHEYSLQANCKIPCLIQVEVHF